jgi:DNA-directed RNA polymerase specialized sigma24 family protein
VEQKTPSSTAADAPVGTSQLAANVDIPAGIGFAANDQYFTATINAAKTRTYRAAATARLSQADREDLYQELVLDLLERASHFDPNKASAGTFTGMVSEHRTADFLNALKKDRSRLTFSSGEEAANDAEAPVEPDPFGDNAVPLWTEDRDLFSDSAALRDLETAIAYMSDDQVALFDLLESHQDLPSACKASDISTATFYRRVSDLQMHLRMFGFRAAA